LWNKLVTFKRRVVKETIIEDGNAIVRTRAGIHLLLFEKGKQLIFWIRQNLRHTNLQNPYRLLSRFSLPQPSYILGIWFQSDNV
jgi:hypothetical protein